MGQKKPPSNQILSNEGPFVCSGESNGECDGLPKFRERSNVRKVSMRAAR